MGAPDLGVSVGDSVKTKETAGKGGMTSEQAQQAQAGIGGTLQVTSKEQLPAIGEAAWDLSIKTNKPVVIVVRAPRQVQS